MDKIAGATPDLTQENIERLAELFPDAVTEAAGEDGALRLAVDFDALREDLQGSIVEGTRERYRFTWPGKAAAKLEARTPCNKTMRPSPEKSIDWDTTQNLYIEGDNLEALKIMRETYAGQIKLIYIDPPYNTGHDFIYDDDFSASQADYAEKSGEYAEGGGRLVANPESNGRFHSDWCSMMYPRLLLARDLLTPDGAIFISIDDNESANLRKICDEVFGASCFVGDIAWQRTYSPRNDSKGIPRVVEHLVVYSRHNEWMPRRLPRSEDMNSLYRSPDADDQEWASDNPAAAGAATHQGMVYGIQHPFTGEVFYPPMGSHWRVGQPGLLSILNEWAPYELRDLHDEERRAEVCGIAPDEVRKDVQAVMLSVPLEEATKLARARYEKGSWPLLYFTSNGMGGMRRKRYLDESQGKVATNLWTHDEVGHTDEAKKELKKLFGGSAPFDTPKPVRLMERILTIASDSNSIVLDFFSGSASMAHAVMQKNAEDGGHRRFILVQIPEPAGAGFDTLCDVGEERIRRAGEKILDEAREAARQPKLGEEPKPLPDVGFRVLRVDDSCLKDTYATPGEYTQATLEGLIDNTEDSSKDLDLLFQVLPKFRIPYSAKIDERSIAGKTVYAVDDNVLLACFDNAISTEVIEAIAKEKPYYAVFRDASMQDDSTVANLEELFKTFSPDTVRRVI